MAKKMSAELKGGDIIGLVGDLGAGKTVFSQGVAAGLGVEAQVTSPTFVIMKIYDCHNHPTIRQLCHVDAYRLKGAADLSALGIEDYLGEKATLTIIEWSDRISDILPEESQIVRIEILDGQRSIEIG